MKLILAVIKPFKVPEVVDAVRTAPDFPGLTIFAVRGFGREKTAPHVHDRAEDLRDFTDHVACLVAAPNHMVSGVVERIRTIAHTGRPGDGKIFVLELEEVLRLGTGERDDAALV